MMKLSSARFLLLGGLLVLTAAGASRWLRGYAESAQKEGRQPPDSVSARVPVVGSALPFLVAEGPTAMLPASSGSGSSAASGSANASGSSWSRTRGRLLPAARNGDAEAASSLYRATIRCENYFDALRYVQRFALQDEMEPRYPGNMEKVVEGLANAQKMLETWGKECAGAKLDGLPTSMYEITFLAAEAGNASAACNYVSGYLLLDKNLEARSLKRYHQHFADHAAKIINQQIQSGSWAMASLLSIAYLPCESQYCSGLWLQDVVEADAVTAYMYSLLDSYGSTGGRLQAVEANLRRMRQSEGLSTAEIARASSAAQAMFDAYYFDKPATSAPWGSCALSDSDPGGS